MARDEYPVWRAARKLGIDPEAAKQLIGLQWLRDCDRLWRGKPCQRVLCAEVARFRNQNQTEVRARSDRLKRELSKTIDDLIVKVSRDCGSVFWHEDDLKAVHACDLREALQGSCVEVHTELRVAQ